MPKLKCDVKQCVHYNDGLCAKNYIDVDGPSANNKKETCCKSYLLKDENTFIYEISKIDQEPSLQTEVYCDAIKCVYEKGQRCYADKIEIANVTNSNTTTKDSGITHCKTFEPKD